MLSRCRYKVGAVLVMGSRVLAMSPNRQRNNPTVDYRHATFHAEEYVLRRTPRSAGTIIYVARLDSSGNQALAKPCPRCEEALREAGVKRAYYTASENEVGAIDFKAPQSVLTLA
ncbi:deaminase [Streptomyces phaeochromogenes]|uniref:deaminase n=1 Tax=Streptomyces phaeochromogenes TaxID=1923 RepID=UPI0033D49CC8